MKRIIFIITLFIFFALTSKTEAFVEKVVFEDDFSQGFEKWQSVRTNAHYWSIENEAAKGHVPNGGRVVEMVPKDEYWDSEWKNMVYEFDFTPVAGADKNFSFKYENASNWYEIHFSFSAIELIRIQDGRSAFRKGANFPLENGQTYRFRLTLYNDNIKFEIDDETVIDVKDFSFNNNFGKIGIKAGTGSVYPTIVFFDNIVVKTIEDGLDVPYFSQRDPLWGADEYDSASNYTWGTPNASMERWGCATTSMAMLMNFHGFTMMPDGITPLTPQTLNNWLKDEDDGYVGEGQINWSAATRLSKEIADLNPGMKKLEYVWHDYNVDKLKTELDEEKPAILRVPEHFVVAKAFANETFNINDPYWEDRTTLASYEETYDNMRLFQPSNTDLSYFLMTSDPELQIVLKDASGSAVSLQNFDEGGIADPTTPSVKQPSVQMNQLPKPESGEYTIELSRGTVGEFKFELFVYDQDANPTIFKKSGEVGPEPIIITLNFDKTGESVIEEVVVEEPEPEYKTFADLHHAIVRLYKEKEIKKFSAAIRLDTSTLVGHFAKQTKVKKQMIQLLELQLRLIPSRDMTSSAREELTMIVQSIKESL